MRAKSSRLIKESPSERLFHVVIVLFLTFFTLLCLLPFINVLASSFASQAELTTKSFILWPSHPTVNAYKYAWIIHRISKKQRNPTIHTGVRCFGVSPIGCAYMLRLSQRKPSRKRGFTPSQL
ncbi:hypothetical protein [Lacticaseibacillus jixiensis]|uniref:hypothetical protein n=1 Tax=Lacticaseibacillus jixiensis TaxID=3231926 RepID=UPI0036F210C3